MAGILSHAVDRSKGFAIRTNWTGVGRKVPAGSNNNLTVAFLEAKLAQSIDRLHNLRNYWKQQRPSEGLDHAVGPGEQQARKRASNYARPSMESPPNSY
jgi:hypothetical protein